MIASLITALHLLGFIAKESAVASLCVAAVLLIIAELGIVSFGLLAFNGLIAFYAAYALHTGNDLLFGITVGWPVLFGIAFVECAIIASVITVYVWLRKQKTTTGTEAMIGSKATILEWNGKKGNVRFEGEIWKAQSDKEMDFNPDDKVTVHAVNKLDLTIGA